MGLLRKFAFGARHLGKSAYNTAHKVQRAVGKAAHKAAAFGNRVVNKAVVIADRVVDKATDAASAGLSAVRGGLNRVDRAVSNVDKLAGGGLSRLSKNASIAGFKPGEIVRNAFKTTESFVDKADDVNRKVIEKKKQGKASVRNFQKKATDVITGKVKL